MIVESPAKAKTISGFLGKDYIVRASMGHVRDLPKSKIGIDTEKNFEPTYMISPDKKKVINELKGYMKSSKHLYIATDEDREGEAIGWHLLEAMKVDPKKKDVKRIVFHEITKDAIIKAIETPRQIDVDLVDAQQARRVLDRLVGYELSPLLWSKIRYGLSAGRVQSVAVRLVVEREREIRAFKPEEYWKVTAIFSTDGQEFEAYLTKFNAKDLKMDSESVVKKIMEALKGCKFRVSSVEEKEVKRNPSPPFITSTLQQEASRKLGFSVKKTMMIAQQLYEGISHGKGTHGLITYMRTDSVNLAAQALKQAKEVITKEYGKEYALENPRFYKGKKGAQEAHEAIRPVDMTIKPADAEGSLSKDQYRLYDLIWKRTLACQMEQARLKAVGVDISAEKDDKETGYVFRATGQTIVFPGFIRVYVEGSDNPEEALNNQDKLLPNLVEEQFVEKRSITPTQHFTKPPARYTEASLVKKLEAEGIGRPSTYAPTISTIITRGYIVKEVKQLVPTDLAEVVTDMLVEHFPDIVDYKFTAELEEDLDMIAEGKKEWEPVIREFYEPFHKTIGEKQKSLKKSDIVNLETTDEKCDKCGSPMIVKLGRFGKFLSCSNYPECKNAKPIPGSEKKEPEKTEADLELERKLSGKKCDKCGELMEIKRGRYGTFLGCSGYPKCKNIQAIVKLIGVKCPECKDGQLVERRTKKGGRLFYGCNKFPKCKYATWEKPGPEGAKPRTEEQIAAAEKKGATKKKPVKRVGGKKAAAEKKALKKVAKKAAPKKKAASKVPTKKASSKKPATQKKTS